MPPHLLRLLRQPPWAQPAGLFPPCVQDEDLFVHTFGIRMLDVPGPKFVKASLQALAMAEEALEQRVASGGAAQGSCGRGGGGEEPSEAQAAALLARVRFRRLLLEALQSMQQYSQAGVEAARRQCQLAEAQLGLVADSAALAAPHDQAPGFVPDINRKHMGLVPPRPVKVCGSAAMVGEGRWGGGQYSVAVGL